MMTVNNSVAKASMVNDRLLRAKWSRKLGLSRTTGTRSSNVTPWMKKTTTKGQRDIKGSSRPSQNSRAASKASRASRVEATMIRAPGSSAKAEIRHSAIQINGAASTTEGRIGRPSKTRAPVQVNP